MIDELTCQRLRDEGAVERYVADTLPAAELEAFEGHLIECGRCQQEVRLAAALRRSLIPASRRRRSTRVAAAIGLAAAAVMALVLVTPELQERLRPPRHRALSSSTQLQPIAPHGAVKGVDVLRWHAVPGSERYRAAIFDQAGAVLWEGETTDTVLPVSGLGDLTRDGPYFWRFEARVGWDRWLGSELVEFELVVPDDLESELSDGPEERR